MCAAFDLAVLATYSDKRFYHFCYHDGIFDGLDDHQKNNFYEIINEYVKKYNIQYIFSVIQDELPSTISDSDKSNQLKDNGNEGRLDSF